MLGNLDNEVIFKKAFTNKTVFKAFVRDILGIEIEVEKIETEKKFDPKIGYVDFELDIFAESIDKRVVIEIQRVEYDHHFDRFLHYFLMLIAEQQKSAREYNIDQTVYVIVVLTAPYTINEKNGKPILDEVLLLKLNPQSLKGEVRDLYGHQFVCLNPNHPEPDTPKQMRDWLDLIYQSIHNPQRPVLNTENEGIRKAMELISFENLTPAERTNAKNKEAAKIVLTKERIAEKIEIAKNLIVLGSDNTFIVQATGLSTEKIQELRSEKT
ncbi:MAG: PD-(D/E)XK nuclease family transposase [Bacteroidia bacterium]|nr:PD-(D/E)XK nuclease family transposase [Bacteroidia bacterium]